nr:RNA ligase family protein [Ralstonia mannitolilytica]
MDGDVIVEEKMDGANLGISISSDGEIRVQNRGHYLQPPFGGQFARLNQWLELHQDALFDVLSESLIIFGEWCAARHSLGYDDLPDWWLAFDVYDRSTQRFWSSERRNALVRQIGSSAVPKLHEGRVSVGQLRKWVMEDRSRYRDGTLEGLVIRKEEGGWLESRAKVVRPDFQQSMSDHWRSRMIEWNHLARPRY